jgi:uncharacterized membrane protein YfcA
MVAHLRKATPFCPACEHPLHGDLLDKSDCKCRQCNHKFRVLVDKDTGTTVLAEVLPRRQPVEPLGLPRGSVRALVVLIICGAAWVLIWQDRQLPEYLVGLLLAIIVYCIGFGSHNTTHLMHDPYQRPDRPLAMPPVVIRLTIIVGFLVTGFYLAATNWHRFVEVRYLELFLIVASLAAGRLYNALIHHADSATRGVARHAKAVLVLAATVVIAFVLLSGTGFELPTSAMVALCALVSFYFGSR